MGFAAAATELRANPLGMPIGCQTWPLRESIGKDFEGALRQIAAGGFQMIEMCSPPSYAKSGFGALAEATQRYFETGLEKATGGDKKKPLVFYCLADCWMSWNAAKRALSLGYADVYWYPEGTDGWEKSGHPLEDRAPEPGF